MIGNPIPLSLHCHYHLEGNGTPWVFIHGLLGNRHDWQHVLRSLPPECNWLCLDLPGHGGSDKLTLTEGKGFTHTADLIASCLNQLGITQCHLIGYSLGGRIAMFFAKQYPQYIASLVLESAHPGLVSEAEKAARLSHDQAWAQRFSHQPLHQVLTSWYQQAVFRDLTQQQQNRLCQLRQSNQGSAIANMLDATSLGRQPNLTPSLQATPAPIHYLVADSDTKFSTIARQLAQQVPNLKLHRFTEAGHNIHWAKPLEYSQILQQLLSK